MLNGDRDRSTEGQRQTTLSGFAPSYNSKIQQTLLQTGTAWEGSVWFKKPKVLFHQESCRIISPRWTFWSPRCIYVGGDTSQTKRMKRVSYLLTSAQGRFSKPVRMEALAIDKSCTPSEPLEISLENYSHLKSLILANSYPRGPLNVDILIGADFSFSFMSM